MRIAVLLVPALLVAQAPAPHPRSSSTASGTKPSTATKASTVTKPTSTASAQKPVTLNSDDEKTIYALGLSIARSLNQFELSPSELAIVEQAMTDAHENKPAIDINVYGPKIQALAQGRAAQVAEKQKALSQAYLAKAGTAPGAVRTPSGLIYKELTPGTGDSPKPTDSVKVNYRGTFVDGNEFDSSHGAPVEFTLNQVIPCWTEGLQHMKVGGKAQLVCPSDIAYGERGNRGIPGGATLLFEVELIGITPAGAPPAPGTPAAPPTPDSPPK